MYDRTELQSRTLAELRRLARTLAIPGRSKLRKAALVEAIVDASARGSNEAPPERPAGGAAEPSRAKRAKRAKPASDPGGRSSIETPKVARREAAARPSSRSSRSRSRGEPGAAVGRSATAQMTTTPNADPPAVSNASVQLLPVEPRRVFITWSVPSSGRSGEIFLALRDVTLIEFDEQRDYGRVDIGPVDVTGRYFVDVRPGRVYQARVEERRNGDPPRALAVSETVTTPSERPSLHEPPRSRPVRDAVVADSGDSGWQPRSSEPVATSSVDRQALERSHIELSAEDLFGRGSPKRKRSSERASRQQQEEELARSVTRDPATERGETAAKGAPAAAAGSKESGSVDDAAIRSTSQRGVTSSAGLAGGPSSADLLGGAVSSEALARGGSSEQLAGASEQLAGPGAPSSAGLGLRPLVEEAPDAGAADARDAALGMDEDALQLELHADVVVYGRAQPGSQVVIDGMQAPVQADGTFEVRFALNPSLRGPQGEA